MNKATEPVEGMDVVTLVINDGRVNSWKRRSINGEVASKTWYNEDDDFNSAEEVIRINNRPFVLDIIVNHYGQLSAVISFPFNKSECSC